MSLQPTTPNPLQKYQRPALLLAVSLVAAFAAIALLRKPASPFAIPATIAEQPATPNKFAAPAQTVPPSPSLAPEARSPVPAKTTAESLEALAATDPSQALALALAEKDDAQRDLLLQAVLRGWARSAPDAAADWAWSHQDAIEQGHAFSAIFNGTQQNPDAALRLAERLSTEHPEQAWSFGRYLVHSFAQAGHFAQAADFAADTHPDHRVDLLTAAYHPWGCQQPEKALQSAIALEDPLRQNAAFHAVIGGWAQTNPQSLTDAAYKFPEGHDRSLALVTGLRSWIEKDPATAEAWIKTHKLTAEESTRALEE